MTRHPNPQCAKQTFHLSLHVPAHVRQRDVREKQQHDGVQQQDAQRDVHQVRVLVHPDAKVVQPRGAVFAASQRFTVFDFEAAVCEWG